MVFYDFVLNSKIKEINLQYVEHSITNDKKFS